MAVKAKERVVNDSLSGKLAIAIVVIILVMMTGTYVLNSTYPQHARVIGGISFCIMLIALVLVLRYADTSFDLLLTHDRLEVERRVTALYHHIVAEIPLSSVMLICPATDFNEDDAQIITGKQVRYTVSPRETDRYHFYTLLYRRDGKVNAIMLQCTKNFYHAIKRQINH